MRKSSRCCWAYAMNCGARANRSKLERRIRARHRAMYSAFRQFCERVLRIPPEPEPPPGDETTTRIFRAAPNYYKYLLVLWAAINVVGLLTPIGFMIVLFIVMASTAKV